MNALEFKELVIPAYGVMEAAALRILRSPDDAADAVQDVMRRLWERHEEIDIHTNITAYAVRSVTNRCMDIVRNSRSTEDVVNYADIVDEDNTEKVVLLEKLDRAIAELDEPRHTIVVMSLEGSCTTDIARAVGLGESNVRQILSRTRKDLRTKLNSQR